MDTKKGEHGTAIHTVLNMCHKGWQHAFSNELAQISTRGPSATIAAAHLGTDNGRSNHQIVGNPKAWWLVGCLCRKVVDPYAAGTRGPQHPVASA